MNALLGHVKALRQLGIELSLEAENAANLGMRNEAKLIAMLGSAHINAARALETEMKEGAEGSAAHSS